jgi:cytochrome P450
MKYENKQILRPSPIKKRKSGKLSIPKGPRTKSPLGNLLEIYRHGPKFFMNLSKEYGDAASFYINNELFIILFDPSMVDAVYTSKQNCFLKGKTFLKIKRLLGEGILTTDQPIHLNHRRMMQPGFHKNKIEDFLQIIFEEAKNKKEEIIKKEQVDLYKEMEDLSFLMISKCLFSSDFKEYQEEIKRDIPLFSKKSMALSILPDIFSSRYIPLKWFRSYHKSCDNLIYLIKKIIENRKKEIEKKEDLFDILLYSKDQKGESLSEKEIINEILSVLLAGYDTTSILLTTSMIWLSLNEKVFEDAKNESMNQKWIIENRPPTIEEIYNSNLIDNIIKETLRLSSPGWSTGRQAKEDVWIQDVFIPKGSHVIVSQYVSHRNPKYFEKPFSWKPERWNNDFEKTLPKGVFHPFGGGSRKCIGENLAWVEAKITLTVMLSSVSWKSFSNSRVFPKINYYVTAAPSEKVMFQVKKND